MLTALEPLIEGDQADQAATTALALLAQAERNISELARDPDFASIKVLRVWDVRIRGPIVASLQALVERSRAGLLFSSSPQANTWLPLFVEALPDVSPLIVDSGTMPLLRDEVKLELQSAGKESAFSHINKAMSFGSASARQRLLDEIGIDNGDDSAAARRLCVGIHEAGYSASKLWTLDPNQKRIEHITTALITRSQNEFLVPTTIADGLSRTQRNHLRIEVLDATNLETLFEKNIAAIEQLSPDASQREAVLAAGLSDGLLIRLPIRDRMDGTVGNGKGIFRETKEWSVPEASPSLPSGHAKAGRRGNSKDSLLGHGRRKARLGNVFDAPLGDPGKGILIGNLHKSHEGIRAADGKVRSLITLPVRQVDPSGYGQKEVSGIFRRFVETVAADCLCLGVERQRAALREMLDKAVEVDQSTIEETERLLRDRLPTISLS